MTPSAICSSAVTVSMMAPEPIRIGASGTADRRSFRSVGSVGSPVDPPDRIRASAPPRSQVSRAADASVRPGGGTACYTITSAATSMSAPREVRRRATSAALPMMGP